MSRTVLLPLAACALLAGCAAPQTGLQVVNEGQLALEAAPLCCSSLAGAERQTLPLVEPATVDITARSPAFNFGGTKAFFVVYELPAFSDPYSVVFSSQSAGVLNDAALLIPRIAIYDDQFQVTRYFDDKTLRNRGNTLERTVFFNAADRRERYLAVYGSDLSSSIERAYSVVSVTPVVAGPIVFNVFNGQDGKSTLRSSPTGKLRIEVQGLAPTGKAATSR